MKGFRILTEDWFTNHRITAGIQFLDLQNKNFDVIPQLPKYAFNQDLQLGDKNDDVKKLQEIFSIMGFFPDTQEFTGLYGGVTRKAVVDFQLARGIIQTKDDIGAGRFGPLTRSKMNSILSQ